MRVVFLFLLVFLHVFGDDRAIAKGDFKDFTSSEDLKAEIKAEVVRDLNLTVGEVKKELDEIIQKSFLRNKNLYEKDMNLLKQELSNVKQELELIKNTLIDLNYQRNLRDDRIRILEQKVKDLEAKQEPEKPKEPNLENRMGEKI
ncbi:MAG: hypothetical protein ACTTIC_01075 [Helicobacteraceae bacterium]